MGIDYAKHFSTKETPQNEPILGREADMVKNAAGGYGFATGTWTQLNRFLILGTEGGSYYVGERELTRENAKNVIQAVKDNGIKVVERILEVSEKGLAIKRDPSLFALAICAKLGDLKTRRSAFEKLPRIARIPTDLFHFATYLQVFGGWGRSTRRAFSNWYDKDPKRLAFLCTKYNQRDGWSHRDILRLCHAKPKNDEYQEIFRYVCNKENVNLLYNSEAFSYIRAVEAAKTADNKSMLSLIKEFRLPMEVVPSGKRSKEVYELMLDNYGMTALIRNLNNLTRVGVIAPGAWDNNKKVIDKLTNLELLKKARIHPIQILTAYKIYKQGHGMKGKSTWTPVPDITDALDNAFYLSFDAVEPTNLRYCLALDTSASMAMYSVAGMPLNAREASGAMLMTRYRTEDKVVPVAFSSGRNNGPMDHKAISVLTGFSRKSSLQEVYKAISGLPHGGTDCALPMLWATQHNIEADVFVIYTDNESWAGRIHPAQALQAYRQKTGINAKMIVVATTATKYSVADPNDPGMMDIVGFSPDCPSVINSFAKGEI